MAVDDHQVPSMAVSITMVVIGLEKGEWGESKREGLAILGRRATEEGKGHRRPPGFRAATAHTPARHEEDRGPGGPAWK
jgi:hypothetical protein